MQNRLFGIQL